MLQEFRTGLELKAARTFAGLSQAELASRAGIHPKTIAYWEKRQRTGMHRRFRKAVTEVFAREGVFFLCGPSLGVCIGEPALLGS